MEISIYTGRPVVIGRGIVDLVPVWLKVDDLYHAWFCSKEDNRAPCDISRPYHIPTPPGIQQQL